MLYRPRARGTVALLCVLTIVLLVNLEIPRSAAQQEQCGVADSISYPVDTNQFRLGQDYGVASPRHQGRLHTGEDWFIGPHASLGQPVSAIARGRVTYSSPTGWGRDGGVVIIEHTFPDGTVIYSQYGHMMQTDTIAFPQRLSCVEAGDIIGAVGDVRPAPHLHFEIRVNQPDIPGPGYTRDDLQAAGWRRPSQVVTNLQARLSRGYAWSVTTGIKRTPLLLDDNSVLVTDDTALRRITSDGRILWRVFTQVPVVDISGFEARPLLTYADGTLARVDFEGQVGESWRLDFTPDQSALRLNDTLIYHTASSELVALTPDRRDILWRLEAMPPYDHGYVARDLIALATEEQMWLISHGGVLVGTIKLDAGASFSSLPDGTLVAYTQGGLWSIDASGEWTEMLEGIAPPGSFSGGVLVVNDGRLFVTDGTDLYAYSRTGTQIWQADLPQAFMGRTWMAQYGNLILLVNSDGNIVVARDGGGFCGYTQVYGAPQAALWQNLGPDDILRVLIGNQLVGLDWQRFNLGC